MSLKISFKKNISENKIRNYILFTDVNFKIRGLKNVSLTKYSSEINKMVANFSLKDKNFLSFNINPTQKIILLKLKDSNSSLENEKIGSEFYDYIEKNSISESAFLEENIKELIKKNKYFLEEFFHGAKLKSYKFQKYKTKEKNKIFNINVCIKKGYLNLNKNKRYESLVPRY